MDHRVALRFVLPTQGSGRRREGLYAGHLDTCGAVVVAADDHFRAGTSQVDHWRGLDLDGAGGLGGIDVAAPLDLPGPGVEGVEASPASDEDPGIALARQLDHGRRGGELPEPGRVLVGGDER